MQRRNHTKKHKPDFQSCAIAHIFVSPSSALVVSFTTPSSDRGPRGVFYQYSRPLRPGLSSTETVVEEQSKRLSKRGEFDSAGRTSP